MLSRRRQCGTCRPAQRTRCWATTLVVLAQLLAATQFIVEEKYLAK